MLKSCKREIGGGSDLMSKLFGEHQNKNISSIVVWSVIFILRVSNAAIRSESAGAVRENLLHHISIGAVVVVTLAVAQKQSRREREKESQGQ